MAFRSLRFFMMPDEFDPLIWEIAGARGLSIVLKRVGWGIPNDQLKNRQLIALGNEQGSILMPDRARADDIFLTSDAPLISGLSPNDLRAAEWGWVQIDVPTVDGNALYLADVGAKSDFYDEQTNQMLENPTSISLFTAVANVIRKRLKRPVYKYSPTFGGGYSVTRGIGYTDGAKEWEDRGGVLAQRW